MRFLNKTEREQGYDVGFGQVHRPVLEEGQDSPKVFPERAEVWQTGRYRQGLMAGRKNAEIVNKETERKQNEAA